MNLQNLSIEQLKQAVQFKEQIAALNSDLDALFEMPVPKKDQVSFQPRRRMSAAARAKIGAAQRARWAKVQAPEPKKKRTMSPEVKARLAKIAKARWKKVRLAGKTRL